MTTFATGRKAEAVAADYLRTQGYEILQQNWRTRYCEIDIVARKAGTVHFVEVKYRADVKHGSGLQYITIQKLRQMSFAARLWVRQYGWPGDYVLSALAVEGRDFVVTNFIEAIIC